MREISIPEMKAFANTVLLKGRLPGVAILSGTTTIDENRLFSAVVEKVPNLKFDDKEKHNGDMTIGHIGESKDLYLLQKGRAHLFEGSSYESVAFDSLALAYAGVKRFVFVGHSDDLENIVRDQSENQPEIVIIEDFLNPSGLHPLAKNGLKVVNLKVSDQTESFESVLSDFSSVSSKWIKYHDDIIKKGVFYFIPYKHQVSRPQLVLLYNSLFDKRPDDKKLEALKKIREVVVGFSCLPEILALKTYFPEVEIILLAEVSRKRDSAKKNFTNILTDMVTDYALFPFPEGGSDSKSVETSNPKEEASTLQS